MLNRIRLWLRTVLTRRRLDREMQEEMAAHLERAAARLELRGLSPEEARRLARREFGNVDYLQEQGRDARGARWIETILADLRFGVRHFARVPITTGIMILVLALGISANTALFTVEHSLITLPPAGIKRDDALVRIRAGARIAGFQVVFPRELSYPELLEYAAHRELFSTVAGEARTEAALEFGDVERTSVAATINYVTDNYFNALRVRPVVGAGLPAFADPDAAAAFVAVISHSLWQQHFAGAADVIGKRLKVNGVDVAIAGVSPPGFRGVTKHGGNVRVWLPLTTRPLVERSGWSAFTSYDSTFMSVIARLQPGVTARAATPTVQTIATRAERASTRKLFGERTTDIVPVLAENDVVRSKSEALAEGALLGSITLLILLITSTNVSALLVGLAVTRRREIAVRLSLGAARTRIIRQLLTESVLLATVAGGLASLLVWFLLSRFGRYFPDVQLALAWPAVAFTFAIALGTGILFGISPALHATRLGVADVLKDSAAAVSASRSRMQRGLVVAQVALTQPLLVGLAALLLIFVTHLRGRPAGSIDDRIVSVSFNPGAGNVAHEAALERMRRMEERFAAIPGVVGAIRQDEGSSIINLAVHPQDRVLGSSIGTDGFEANTHFAPAGYFAVMDIPLVRGRDFTPDEHAPSGNAVVIGSDVARRLWGSADPIGRRLVRSSDSQSLVVVGVVDEVKAGRSDIGNEVRIFVPNIGTQVSSILVRAQLAGEPMIPKIRAVAKAEDPQMPIRSARTLAAIETEQQTMLMRASGAAAGGGLLALFLSAISLYAVVAFAVRQRTREIGIRTALGANRGQVVTMFFLRGVRLSVMGLVIGLPFSLIALRLIASGVGLPKSGLPVVAALIATSVIMVAALATWIPARRAAGVDPLLALRHE